MAKANGLRVLSDAELDLVAGGAPGNGNGAQHTDVTTTLPGFTQTEKTVTTPSDNMNGTLSTTTVASGGRTATFHETFHIK